MTMLAKQLAEKTGLPIAACDDVLAALVKAIFDGTGTIGGSVHVHNLGTFTRRPRKARAGRNPQTGEAIAIPAGSRVHFKPASSLR